MARLDRMMEEERSHLLSLPCPTYPSTPWAVPPPLGRCRVALISTDGLHRQNDRPFEPGATDDRIIPAETPANELVMSQISAKFESCEATWGPLKKSFSQYP
jgi:D-proline reductase (dithiol) PrdB